MEGHEMKYRTMGNSGIDISVIGQGTWEMGNDFFGEVDDKLAIDAIRASIDAGVNMVDTAAAYGLDGASERVVAKAIKGLRDKVVLATKLGVLRIDGEYVRCLNTNIMRRELEDSLRRLETDYIDLYFVHWPDFNNSIDDALEMMVKFKQEGKIRAIGVSNFDTALIEKAIKIADICVVQPPMSMLNRTSIENGILPYCNKNSVGVITYGSLGGGILTGKMQKPVTGGKELRSAFYSFYEEPMWSKCQKLLDVLRGIAGDKGTTVAQVSINWVLAQPGVTCSLMGATTPDMAYENASAAEWELTADELAYINAKFKEIME
jgi:aryl-alcohol dehydrogenase-like predicted oxidoreductase